MERPRILVIYGTNNGQTAKIAKLISERLSDRGCMVDVRWGKNLTLECPITHYNGVVVGASVYLQNHQGYIEEFVRAHRPFLADIPTAFFSVSAAAGADDPQGRHEARKLAEKFTERTGWTPGQVTTFGGGLPYSQYRPVVRQVMKWLMGLFGGDTDTSRDYEYTDWKRVEDFAQKYFDSLGVEIAPAPTPEQRGEGRRVSSGERFVS